MIPTLPLFIYIIYIRGTWWVFAFCVSTRFGKFCIPASVDGRKAAFRFHVTGAQINLQEWNLFLVENILFESISGVRINLYSVELAQSIRDDILLFLTTIFMLLRLVVSFSITLVDS